MLIFRADLLMFSGERGICPSAAAFYPVEFGRSKTLAVQ